MTAAAPRREASSSAMANSVPASGETLACRPCGDRAGVAEGPVQRRAAESPGTGQHDGDGAEEDRIVPISVSRRS